MIQLLRNPENVVRAIAVAVTVLALLAVYQLAYVPNGHVVNANLDQVEQLLTEVNEQKDFPTEFQRLRQRWRKELEQKGIQEEEQWLVRSDADLRKQLLRILKENSVQIRKCEIEPTGENNSFTTASGVAIEFQCELPQLFRVLQSTDNFPSNVKVNKFELYESPGPQLCQVQMNFHVDQAPQKNQDQNNEKAAI